MRFWTVFILTASQFTAFPFLAIVTANTLRQAHEPAHQTHVTEQVELTKGTVIYKSVEM